MAKWSKWASESGREQLEAWAASGMKDEALIAAMGVSASTFYAWVKPEDKSYHAEIAEAIRAGRRRCDDVAVPLVENALLQAALGGEKTVKKAVKVRKREYDQTTGRCIKDEERIEIVEETVYVPPNVVADQYFLNNRAGGRWSRAPEAVTDTDGEKETLEGALSDE